MNLFSVTTRQGTFHVEATCDVAAELEIEERGHGVAITSTQISGVGYE